MKIGREVEGPSDVIGKCTHAECLGGIVAGVDDHDPQLIRIDGRPVRSLADDQSVDAILDCFAQRVGRCAGAVQIAHRFVIRFGSEGELRTAPPHRRATAPAAAIRSRGGDVGFTAHADVDRLVSRKTCERCESELAREQYVVADLGMRIEWEVRGIERDPGCEQCVNAAKVRTSQGLKPAPEQTVMHQEQICALLRGAPDRALT